MSESKPVVSSVGLSTIWIIPSLAILLGIWMVVYSFMNEGPKLEISFNNADGLTAGKTKLKYLSVDIGQVESVTLNADASGIIVKAKLEKEHKHLLKDDTRFWVEKARIGTGGVSGLSTILSGAYIKLALGNKDLAGPAKYVGLEVPPLTEAGAPGARLVIEAESASSVGIGDSVLYHDYVVGRVESMRFDQKKEKISYAVFIDAPYHKLLNTSVRFWNNSGFSLTASAEGVNFRAGSLETILSGGISFGIPEGI
ncbi:MAG TPA: MCE family protein, partial [Gammaproteobacteria bacterium]|nr:MCE family protein [Gammaproteobacteria bacterium]